MLNKKNKGIATVIAIEDKITDNEQESLFLKVAGDDEQLLKELKYLYEFEPNNAIFREEKNGNGLIYIIDPLFSFSEEDEIGFEPLAFVLFSALETAAEHGYKKIIFPTLDGWNSAFDKRNTAECTLHYFQHYIEKEGKNIEEIIIKLNNRETFNTFSKVLEKYENLPIKLEEVSQ